MVAFRRRSTGGMPEYTVDASNLIMAVQEKTLETKCSETFFEVKRRMVEQA